MTQAHAAKFTTGSMMRHVVVMTATGSIGLMAVFVVDLLNLFYISLLGEQELAAAIGYAGTVLFFATSICIGVTISGVALVSQALGARERDRARRLAASSLVFMIVVSTVLTLATLPFVGSILSSLGAEGHTHAIAWRFLLMVLPSTPLLGIGMSCAGLLRSAGDARRAMYVTLVGGLVTAALDPLLIFAFGLGVDGAAIASVFSRVALTAVGLYGAVKVHDLVARPSAAAAWADAGALNRIALPAVLANVATPAGNAFVTATVATFGDSAVAGFAVVWRIVPVAFGAIFALSGSIGPILGQNLGARRFDRVRRALGDSLTFIGLYCVAVWLVLALLTEPIVTMFGASGDGATLIRFFCLFMAGTFVFVGALFVATAAFNNLGYPTLSTAFNWGRATLGTIPFVWLGAHWFGAVGVLVGQAAGSIVFGIGAILASYQVVKRIAARGAAPVEEQTLITPAIGPFTSGKGATAIDWADLGPDEADAAEPAADAPPSRG